MRAPPLAEPRGSCEPWRGPSFLGERPLAVRRRAGPAHPGLQAPGVDARLLAFPSPPFPGGAAFPARTGAARNEAGPGACREDARLSRNGHVAPDIDRRRVVAKRRRPTSEPPSRTTGVTRCVFERGRTTRPASVAVMLPIVPACRAGTPERCGVSGRPIMIRTFDFRSRLRRRACARQPATSCRRKTRAEPREVRNLKSNAGNDTGRHFAFGGVMLFSNTSPLSACAANALPAPALLPSWRVFPPDIRTRQAAFEHAWNIAQTGLSVESLAHVCG